MLKSLIASSAAVSAVVLASPVLAGPYANIENNAGFQLDDGFSGAVTDIHVGYEGSDGPYSFYAQGGFALVDDTNDIDTELSGKIGASVAVADSGANIYGELSGITTDDEPVFGTKIGLKFPF